MPESAQQHIPILRFYEEFPNDWEALSQATRQGVADFLERLQKNPFDPEIMRRTMTHQDFYAYRLPDGYVIYWKLELERSLSVPRTPERIWILALEPGF